MRTTVNFPDELHQLVTAIARDRHATFGETVVALVETGLGHGNRGQVEVSDATNLPTVTLGRTLTSEDVRRLDDE